MISNKVNKNPSKDSLSVVPAPGEDPEQMIKRFTKKVRNSGLMQELMIRKSYEKPSVKKKRKSIAARFSRLSEDKDR